jgi:hypothetical protein
VPVEDHDGGVVVELAVRRLENGLNEVLDRFARMHRGARCHQLVDLGAGSVALEHAVGEEDQAVT